MHIYFIKKFFRTFPAFRHRNYKLYFTGQLISLIGTWLQIVALGWLVLQLTKSAFHVGLVASISMLPVLFFSMFGGVIVDRLNKKKILFFTQTMLMCFAFTLGFLTITGAVNIYIIYTLAFMSGIISALDMPARQSFVIEMVGKDSLSSAIALNSGTFNAARVLGPAVAGIIIALVGIGGAFIINGLSFLAVIVALYFINVNINLPSEHPRPIEAIKQGLSYAFSHQSIKLLLSFATVAAVFTWGITSILPFIIEHDFHLGVSSLGYFYGSIGIGAIFATIIVSAFSHKINPMVFIQGGNLIAAAALILFTFTTNLYIAVIFLFFLGFGLLAQISTINSTIQHLVEDNLRGRVMSLYTLAFMGMLPLGSFQIGLITEKLGTGFAIRSSAVIALIAGAFLYFKLKNTIKIK